MVARSLAIHSARSKTVSTPEPLCQAMLLRNWTRSSRAAAHKIPPLRTYAAFCTPTLPPQTAPIRWKQWRRPASPKGYEYIGITDHSKAAHYAGGPHDRGDRAAAG
jgi:hypothetical protein